MTGRNAGDWPPAKSTRKTNFMFVPIGVVAASVNVKGLPPVFALPLPGIVPKLQGVHEAIYCYATYSEVPLSADTDQ